MFAAYSTFINNIGGHSCGWKVNELNSPQMIPRPLFHTILWPTVSVPLCSKIRKKGQFRK